MTTKDSAPLAGEWYHEQASTEASVHPAEALRRRPVGPMTPAGRPVTTKGEPHD